MKRMLGIGLALATLLLPGCRPPLEIAREARTVHLRLDLRTTYPGLGPADAEAVRASWEAGIREGLAPVAEVRPLPDTVAGLALCPAVEVRIEGLFLADVPSSGEVLRAWAHDRVSEAMDEAVRRLIEGDRGPSTSTRPLDDTLAGRYFVRGSRLSRLGALGYRPILASGVLVFRERARVWRIPFTGWDLLDRFRPLAPGADPATAIRREEARVLSEHLLAQLGSRLGWQVGPAR